MIIEGKKIGFIGGGESGIGAAILGRKKRANVFVSDANFINKKFIKKLSTYNIPYEENGHNFERLLESNLIIKSPGINPKSPIITKLREANIPVIGDLEFACHFTNADKICFTGSNGKTTSVMLMYHVMLKAGLDVELAGNIGISFAEKVATTNPQYFVLEVSSFMLDDIDIAFRPKIAIMLNITPDHLDRYENSFDKYVESKFKILKNMTADDIFIYNADDTAITNYLSNHSFDTKMYSFSTQNEGENQIYMDKDNSLIFKYLK